MVIPEVDIHEGIFKENYCSIAAILKSNERKHNEGVLQCFV